MAEEHKCRIGARGNHFPEKSKITVDKPQPCLGNREDPGKGWMGIPWRDPTHIQLLGTPGAAAQLSEPLLPLTQSGDSSG